MSDVRGYYDEQIKTLQAQVKLLGSFGVDDFEDGATITWTRTFDRSLTHDRSSRNYSYVALKAGPRWWITGQKGDRGLAYDDLILEHLQHADADSINIVAKWAVFE